MDRVRKDRPCPICGRPDWCLVAPDESAAICARISAGSRKSCGDAGWLHILREDSDWRRRPRVRRVSLAAERTDLCELAAHYSAKIDLGELDAFAESLGLSVAGLHRLRIGWSEQNRVWSFSMHGPDSRVRGIRLRAWSGKKWAVKGGRDGVFLPMGLTFREPLLLPEGPTDTAALLDLGFEAIGRPHCRGGTRIIQEIVRQKKPPGVVIVSDRDANRAGQDGAEALALSLLAYCPSVRVVQPPPGINDARAWLLAGATAGDLQKFINLAPNRELSIRRFRRWNRGA